MVITLAVIGALAILGVFLIVFVRAIGLTQIRLVFEQKPLRMRTKRSLKHEKPPKQLNS